MGLSLSQAFPCLLLNRALPLPSSPSAGSSRRYQVNAVHTSKACNVISKYTAFVPVDINKSRYLPTVVGYPNSGKAEAGSSQWAGGGSGVQRSLDRWERVQRKA